MEIKVETIEELIEITVGLVKEGDAVENWRLKL